MQRKLKLAVFALCYAPLAFAQTPSGDKQVTKPIDESAFTFTEAQLGDDDDMTQNISILNSSSNLYASGVGYLFSPVRFRYRALNQSYNDIYINGAPVNDMESGQFRYSQIGGLNQQTKNVDFSLPFEDCYFGMSSMGGSNNYDFRPGNMATGHRAAVSAANRNYNLRGMYNYSSGFDRNGWAVSAGLTYRWAKRGYVEGTFYNALSYFLGIQKLFGDKHSVSFVTWGNPTERGAQGSSTDEVYWLTDNRYYNSYWGYQNGHVRNSRVVTEFSPSAVLTWDWNIDKDLKLTTTVFGRYSMYKSTKLNYGNADNPHPDYWKTMPSSYFYVWGDNPLYSSYRTQDAADNWALAYDYWKQPGNQQINWNQLYYANTQAAKSGNDALYFIQAKNSDNATLTLASTLTSKKVKNGAWNAGFVLSTNNGHHYQTMEDLLGAKSYHNINTYALGKYAPGSNEIQYDLNSAGPNNLGRLIYKGDIFGYNYNIFVHKANLWTSYQKTIGRVHLMGAAKLGGVMMRREGHMRNGLFANSSYGKSEYARFGEGGAKGSLTFDAGSGHTFLVGVGYQWNAPKANVAFASPEMTNDFALNLKDEHVFTSEVGYQYNGSWLHANINAYYNRMDHVTEWQNFYYDDINSFSYVSMTGIKKEYYGVEAGLKFKVSSAFDINLLGTISQAKNINNAQVRYLISTEGTYSDAETVYNKDMHEAGTPLSAFSLGLSYHQGGWFIDLNGNYYDRIYLSYSPCSRYESSLKTRQNIYGDVYDNEGNLRKSAVMQAQGNGGFMLDGSIGRLIRLKKGQISINFSITNILNNQNIVTGGYEQSRSDYSNESVRAYQFSKNPKKFYAFGPNGLLNIAYKF